MGFPKELLLYPEYQEGKVPRIKKNHQKLISDAAAELEKLKLTMKKEVDDEGILEENFVSYKSDFDDLLCNVWDFLNRDKIPPCYDWIQVDEVQDLNKLQLDIIRKLTKKDGKETVVYYGDINQAIFSFMGGCPENVTSLRDEVNEKGGTVVSFNVNHRSSAKLMQYQRHCINHLFRKINKKKSNLISDGERKDIENPVEIRRYKTDRQQNADVVNMAISMLKQNPSECVAILCRTNNECIKFEKSFIKKGETPYRISDETFSSMSGIHEALNEIESRYSGGFPDGLSIYQELNACFAAPGAIVSVFLEYAKRLEESSSYKDPESLLNILSTVTLEDVYGHKVITSGIILSTVHKAKGESFETVIVPSVVKGEYPFNFSKDINEDARVFYVAISRAINKLIITYFDKGRIPYMKKDPVKKTCGKHRLAKVSVRTHTSTDKIFKTEPSDFIVRPRGILCLE